MNTTSAGAGPEASYTPAGVFVWAWIITWSEWRGTTAVNRFEPTSTCLASSGSQFNSRLYVLLYQASLWTLWDYIYVTTLLTHAFACTITNPQALGVTMQPLLLLFSFAEFCSPSIAEQSNITGTETPDLCFTPQAQQSTWKNSWPRFAQQQSLDVSETTATAIKRRVTYEFS